MSGANAVYEPVHVVPTQSAASGIGTLRSESERCSRNRSAAAGIEAPQPESKRRSRNRSAAAGIEARQPESDRGSPRQISALPLRACRHLPRGKSWRTPAGVAMRDTSPRLTTCSRGVCRSGDGGPGLAFDEVHALVGREFLRVASRPRYGSGQTTGSSLRSPNFAEATLRQDRKFPSPIAIDFNRDPTASPPTVAPHRVRTRPGEAIRAANSQQREFWQPQVKFTQHNLPRGKS